MYDEKKHKAEIKALFALWNVSQPKKKENRLIGNCHLLFTDCLVESEWINFAVRSEMIWKINSMSIIAFCWVSPAGQKPLNPRLSLSSTKTCNGNGLNKLYTNHWYRVTLQTSRNCTAFYERFKRDHPQLKEKWGSLLVHRVLTTFCPGLVGELV